MRSLPTLGPGERQFLLSGARLEPSADELTRFRQLAESPLDWEAIVAHAHLHSIAPLIHRNLARIPGHREIPPPARRSLLKLFHRTGFQNRHYATENARLLADLNEAGLAVLIPKGISLVEHVYQGLSLRPLIDLMFLIKFEQVEPVDAFMRDRGYALKPHRPGDGLFRWSCPQRVYRVVRDIEVHVLLVWNLVTWPRLHLWDPEPIWQRARTVEVSGREALVLSPEDLVLYLCLQADNHGFFNRVLFQRACPEDLLFADWSNNRIIRFTDIYETVRHFERRLDWDAVIATARASELVEALHASLWLTNALIGPTVSTEILAELRDQLRSRGGVRKWVATGLSRANGPDPVGLAGRIGRFWCRLRPLQQLRLARLIGWLEVTFPGGRDLRFRYDLDSEVGVTRIYIAHGARALARSAASLTSAYLAKIADGVRGRRRTALLARRSDLR
jgi:hypothetical protein